MNLKPTLYDTEGNVIEHPPKEEGFYHIMVMGENGWYWHKEPIPPEMPEGFIYIPREKK